MSRNTWSKITHKNHILAIDVGLKRIGVAELIAGVIIPLPAILRKNRTQAANDLKNLIQDHQILKLIIGLPLIDGEATQFARQVTHFAGLIDLQIEKIFISEELSSKESLALLGHLSQSSRASAKRDGRLDSLSACNILQRFLDGQN